MQTPLVDEEAFNFDEFTTFSERLKKSNQETAIRMEKGISS